MVRNVKIIGTGSYLPKGLVTSEELDKKLGYEKGTVEKYSGIKTRYFVEDETAAQMGARAIEEALKNAGLTVEDIDCIVCASASSQQPTPHTSAFIQKELGWENSRIPCFDIACVCMSFFVAFDVMSSAIEAGRYKNVIIVSTEAISKIINWKQSDSCVLLGDAAAAVIIGKSKENETSKIICSDMETYSEGVHFAELRGGGTYLHASAYSEETRGDFYFDMNGKGILEMMLKYANDFLKRLQEKENISMKDIDMFIPHQASSMAMKVMNTKFGFTEKNLVKIIHKYGNVAAACMPLTLHEGITQGKIKRGNKVMVIGGGGGFTVGAIVFEY